MATAKKKYPKFKTPVGIAVYPKLHRAYKWDEATERSLPNPDGDLSTKLSIPSKDAQELIKFVKDTIKESGLKPKHIPYADEEVDGDKTGNVLISLKAYGKTKEGEINKLKFFDSAGTPLKGVIAVTGGSQLRLQGYISVSKQSARLNIREVQIIELAEIEGEGFDAVKGGGFKASDIGGDDDTTTNNDNDEETSEENETEQTTGDDEEEF